MSDSNSLALVNGKVILPERIAAETAVVVTWPQAGSPRIAAVLPESQLPPELERLDVGGRWITPGLIDIHIHGALGHTFNEPDEHAFQTILDETPAAA